MDDAVPDRVYRAGRSGIIGAWPGQGPPDGLSVVANGRSLAMRRGIADQKRTRGLIADPVDQAARQPASLSSRICRRRRLDELEFQGRAATIEHQHFHRDHPPRIITPPR
jgi:hypothetical protein